MKLLVTGGAGFIGSNFILQYLKNNPADEIVNLDKLTYAGNLENLKSVEKNSHYKFVKADICNYQVIEPLVENCDIVVHFAAESHVDRSILGPTEFVQTNVLGTQTILEAARKFNRRFHHVSTDEVFGQLELNTDTKFSETTAYNPSSPYSASKAASDHLVRAYYETYKLPITISNCTNNYGPFQFPEKLIPLFITNLIEGKKVPVYGNGLNVRDWIHVDDHNRGVELIIKKGEIGQTYCLGGESEKSNLEITKIILNAFNKGEESMEYVKDRPGHDLRYAMDISKIKKELGFNLEKTFEQGINETIEWYKNNEVWWKNVKSGEYKEYYQKQYQ
ncbi:MAG: dTDP-glucose 4,6-dehydratase [Patescibacteria group bacterium]